jgi:multidrug resistance efflux pump
MKKILTRLILLAIVVGAGWGAWRFFSGLSTRSAPTPATRVRQGDVVVRSFARGELRAVRTISLTAPNLFGTVQITRMAPLGALAKEKDLIVEFDDSEVESRLEQKQLELDQLDEQIKKAQADLAIRNNQDQVDLLRSRYTVRRSELEVKRNELLSTIDQKRNLLNLEESKRRLKQLESDIKSKQEQAQAELNVLRERRNRAVLEIQRERIRLAQVKLLAPIGGLVAVKQNRSGFSGMFGTSVPDLREGDQVPPGSAVADVLDLSELEVLARVGELDRANLHEGQDVLIRLDALADKTFNGKIKSMSGTASANVFSSDPGKKFDVVFSVDMHQLLTSLGAKPDQIARIMATAEANRKKPISQASTSVLAMFGGAMGGDMAGGMPGGMPGGPQMMVMGGPGGGGAEASGGGGGRRMMMGGAGGGMPEMSDEQRQKMREAMQKALNGRNIQDLSAEERRDLFAKIMPQGQGGASKKGGEKKGESGKGGEQPAAGGAPTIGFNPPGGGEGRGARGGGEGRGGRGGGEGRGEGRGGGMGMLNAGIPGGFTQKDLDSAQLPAPPEPESQLDVLLRPGLLADVEIIVEKVPNATFVPNQAVFEKGGKLVVFVRQPDGKFEARPIQVAKRSESVTIIASGVKPGDSVAMTDPTVKPGEKKSAKKEEPKGAGGAMGAMPGGGGAR